jgi:hypothetical protein
MKEYKHKGEESIQIKNETVLTGRAKQCKRPCYNIRSYNMMMLMTMINIRPQVSLIF